MNKRVIIFLAILFVVSFFLIKRFKQSKPPDVCDCTLNALKVNTAMYDSLLRKTCENFSSKLNPEEKQERILASFDCPLVKEELQKLKEKSEREESEKLYFQNCNQMAAKDFVKQRVRDIGGAIMDGPVLVESDNSNCYYVFTMIIQKGFSVEGCDIAVQYKQHVFDVKYVNCQ